MTRYSRRRFLSISAACMSFPAAVSAAGPSARWTGIALGAPARMQINGLSDAEAAPIFDAVTAEVSRLENIFSLYRPNSELCRLNRTGHLSAPSAELLQLLSLCSALHEASGGAFDPTIQPLWLALANSADASARNMELNVIGWNNVIVNTDEIRLPVPGVSALTLNGVAQGEVTDRVSRLLRSFGLRDVLVDMGEIRANGRRGDGRAWQVGLASADGTIENRIRLSDRAVATSSPAAMTLPGGQGHILNPIGQRVFHSTVSVSAPNAALADGLSTALCAIPQHRIADTVSRFPSARIEMLM